MNNELYYFITVFSRYDDKGPHNMRCWGFYNSLGDAHMVVENNITDIWETIYDFAVIEEYHPGISGYNFYRWFYKYNKEKDIYECIEEPKELKYYAGFAMG